MSSKIDVDKSASQGFKFTKTRITLKCSECSTWNEVPAGQLPHEVITCTKCNKSISLSDVNKSLEKTMTNITKSIDDVRRSLENT
jgi:peptide subunit release factor 1 (eRF1)